MRVESDCPILAAAACRKDQSIDSSVGHATGSISDIKEDGRLPSIVKDGEVFLAGVEVDSDVDSLKFQMDGPSPASRFLNVARTGGHSQEGNNFSV